jgi:hypothetical protein
MSNYGTTLSLKSLRTGTIPVSVTHDELHTLRTARSRQRLSVLNGTVYVTVEGDPIDHILKPGDSMEIPPRRKVVSQGLPAGSLTIG